MLTFIYYVWDKKVYKRIVMLLFANVQFL